MSSVKKATLTSILIALCYVLPLAFHALGLGAVFSPLHIPVLLCGLICGWSYGAFCGLAGPVISSLLSGMPAAAQLPHMIAELMVYGLASGLLMRYLPIRNRVARLYCALVPAMVLGRAAGGVVRSVIYLRAGTDWSLAAWAAAYFTTALPGIALHLILIPALYLAVWKAGLIEENSF